MGFFRRQIPARVTLALRGTIAKIITRSNCILGSRPFHRITQDQSEVWTSPMDTSKLPYLNLGCGQRFAAQWTNADLHADQDVLAVDLRKPLPFSDETFEVVYHSHVLEHIRPGDAPSFIRECYRVLRPNGTIRVVVPDLETIVREYLKALESALANHPGADHDYDWMLLELYDQAVREESGGLAKTYLASGDIPNLPFVLRRWGEQARNILRASQGSPTRSWPLKLRRRFRRAVNFCANAWSRLTSTPSRYRALQIGLFRESGEIHRWMYDRYSLSRLLMSTGFRSPRVMQANSSRIPDWTTFHLDTLDDGSVYKPDSLFMEAVKSIGP